MDYTGPLRSTCQTNVAGIRIGELLPELGKVADKYSLIRSMTHGVNGHETASYLTQTGRMPGRLVYPAAGAVVTAFKGFGEKDGGEENLIPPYIVLTSPQGRFSESGFMGIKYKPFATGGDPNAARFAVEGIISPDLSESQQLERRKLLQQLNSLKKAVPSSLGTFAGRTISSTRLRFDRRGRRFRLRFESGKRRDARAIRSDEIRAIVFGRASLDRKRFEVRHDQPRRMGHAQESLWRDAAQVAGA